MAQIVWCTQVYKPKIRESRSGPKVADANDHLNLASQLPNACI